MEAPTLFIAFLAGFLSFLSPCVLPLVPAYIGYMSGSATRQVRTGSVAGAAVVTSSARWIVMAHALMFVIGFTLVFAVLGNLVGAAKGFFFDYREVIQRSMGVLLIVFGIFMVGVVNIPFLNYTRRLDIRPASNLGYLRSFLIGLGFGVGWTPCVGPTLGLIMTLALQGREGEVMFPFLAYSLGLALPFLATALAMGRISAILKKLTRRSFSLKIGGWKIIDEVNVVSLVSGLLLIIMGVLIAFDWLKLLAPPTSGVFDL